MYMYVWTPTRRPQEPGASNKEQKSQGDKKLEVRAQGRERNTRKERSEQ